VDAQGHRLGVRPHPSPLLDRELDPGLEVGEGKVESGDQQREIDGLIGVESDPERVGRWFGGEREILPGDFLSPCIAKE
jgi:hypothetical protein